MLGFDTDGRPGVREHSCTREADELTGHTYRDGRRVVRSDLKEVQILDLWECGTTPVGASGYEARSSLRSWWQQHVSARAHREAMREVENMTAMTGVLVEGIARFRSRCPVR